ncbi:uncharacterized protein LY89DRAFT_108212 [Mollisia scopiformis]|uniref:C2H2-type domain-containing protein n=1 Tax=Mollisia scopiformis TaxID=149040 RepID=A0A194X525_MOLSC|nr:uncharacterized protein LY89DRAFT_108212 [Mollisia scopiformis]KUJ15280.1 hypothetical protein LY89DRAFT_108212 [Mollisia scopiformis]
MEYNQNGNRPSRANANRRTNSMNVPTTTQPGLANSSENLHIPRTQSLSYHMDANAAPEETHSPMTAMQSEDNMPFNGFSNVPTSFFLPDQLNYSPEDPIYNPGWSSHSQYGSMDDYGRPDAYGQGHSNFQGASSVYEAPDAHSSSATYNHAESSAQPSMWTSNYQAGQGISDADFDIASFQMPARTLTQTPAPISSADTFDGSTVPLSFENMLSDPQFSPTGSAASSHSSYDTMWSTSRNATSHTATNSDPNVPIQPAASPTQMTQMSPPSDTNSLKPYRCNQRGCTRSYARKFELYRHQRRHTGVKSHHCQVPGCERGPRNGFYRKDHLRQHMRQVHGS